MNLFSLTFINMTTAVKVRIQMLDTLVINTTKDIVTYSFRYFLANIESDPLVNAYVLTNSTRNLIDKSEGKGSTSRTPGVIPS